MQLIATQYKKNLKSFKNREDKNSLFPPLVQEKEYCTSWRFLSFGLADRWKFILRRQRGSSIVQIFHPDFTATTILPLGRLPHGQPLKTVKPVVPKLQARMGQPWPY